MSKTMPVAACEADEVVNSSYCSLTFGVLRFHVESFDFIMLYAVGARRSRPSATDPGNANDAVDMVVGRGGTFSRKLDGIWTRKVNFEGIDAVDG
jgi:hypothetical protein